MMLLLISLLIPAATLGKHPLPPPPRYSGGTAKLAPVEMAQAFTSWTPRTHCNLWELSGQHEGDIMVDNSRNALSDPTRLWPDATVPYYIDTEDFDKEERKAIKEAMSEIEEETCIDFRPYKEKDEAYVVIRGDKDGCWSYVGRKTSGQTLNLGEKCVRHGIVVHELLHALGLHHQQSSDDRDEYVTIHWKNIEEDHKHNFDKYNSSSVTDYGVGYDYASIMHYSAYAFSKNDKMTITPKEGVRILRQDILEDMRIMLLQYYAEDQSRFPNDKKATIGQRKSLSKKDIIKVNKMYNCTKSKSDEESNEMSNLADLFS